MNKKIYITSETAEKLWSECGKDWELSRSDTLSPAKTDEILSNIQLEFNLKDHKQAFHIVALLCQNGGCAKACSGNLTIKAYGQIIKLANIRSIFSKSGEKHGLRKFAKTHCESIATICQVKKIPGHLTKKILRMHPDLNISPEKKVLLSDFQLDNPNLDSKLKAYILESFKTSSTYVKQNKQKK